MAASVRSAPRYFAALAPPRTRRPSVASASYFAPAYFAPAYFAALGSPRSPRPPQVSASDSSPAYFAAIAPPQAL